MLGIITVPTPVRSEGFIFVLDHELWFVLVNVCQYNVLFLKAAARLLLCIATGLVEYHMYC